MTYDYDALYAETPDALGAPTPAIVAAFERFAGRSIRVLDVGCGQGRDALFLARLGHRVVGVDLSPHGIRDLQTAAQAEGLEITATAADIRAYAPDGLFDAILVDRTLHMLAKPDRTAVLTQLVQHVAPGGWLFIADEASNRPAFEAVLQRQPEAWQIELSKRGYLFAQRNNGA